MKPPLALMKTLTLKILLSGKIMSGNIDTWGHNLKTKHSHQEKSRIWWRRQSVDMIIKDLVESVDRRPNRPVLRRSTKTKLSSFQTVSEAKGHVITKIQFIVITCVQPLWKIFWGSRMNWSSHVAITRLVSFSKIDVKGSKITKLSNL